MVRIKPPFTSHYLGMEPLTSFNAAEVMERVLKQRAFHQKYELVKYLAVHDESFPWTLQEVEHSDIGRFDDTFSHYIYEAVEKNTNLAASACEKLNGLELTPFLEQTLQSLIPQPLKIEPDYKTKPLTKQEAARRLGFTGQNPNQWIDRRTMRVEKTGGLFFFDYRDFPSAVWEAVLPRATWQALCEQSDNS